MSIERLENLYMTSSIHNRMRADLTFAEFVTNCIRRFRNHDWGDVDEEDKKRNDRALTHDDRIFASYNYGEEKIWIVTDWDKVVTNILYPSEY